MTEVLALLGYGGLVALIVPQRIRPWFGGWIALVTLTIGPQAIPLAVVMFLPVGILYVWNRALYG